MHELDASLLDGLWAQFTNAVVVTDGLQIALDQQAHPVASIEMPVLPDLSSEGGFTIDFWVRFDSLAANQTVLDSTDDTGRGLAIATTPAGTIECCLSDGATTNSWDTDPGALSAQRWQHVAITVDGSADIITFVVNGRLLDGGTARDFGWTRLNSALGNINGADVVDIAPGLQGELGMFRIYDHPLRTSEVIGNWRAWTPPLSLLEVADSFRYNGRYEPDSAVPPPGNATWAVITEGGLDIVPNDPASGVAVFDDHSSSARMAMTHIFADPGFNADPVHYGWTYRFKMKLVFAPTDNSYLMLFGVRNEGTANGKAVMLAFDSAGYLCFAHANGSGIQFADLGGENIDYRDGLFHSFTVTKTDHLDGFMISTTVDGHLLDSRHYDSFEADASTEGFGIWSSTPGQEYVVVDDVQFGSDIYGTLVRIR